MLQDLLSIILGGGNNQPAPAQFQQAGPPIPTPNPETSIPGAGQPLAQPVQSPGIGQRIGNHIQGIDWKSSFDDAAAGLAGLDPTAPALQAAAMGYSGARNNASARESSASQAALAETERQRELEKHTANMRSKKLGDLNTASQIEEREGKRSPNQPLEFEDLVEIEKLVNDFGQKLGLNQPTMSPSRRAEALQSLEEYREEMTARVKGGETPEAAASEVENGEGSADQHTYASPAQISSEKEYSSLPSGAYFINPADGSILQKP